MIDMYWLAAAFKFGRSSAMLVGTIQVRWHREQVR